MFTPSLNPSRSLIAENDQKFRKEVSIDNPDDLIKGPNWRSSSLLHHLTAQQLDQLEDKMEEKQFCADEYIIREGEKGEHLYLIETGEVEILKDGVKLASKKEGDHFGAMALMNNAPRSADVRATKNTVVKTISTGQIKELSNRDFFQVMLMNHLEEHYSTLREMNNFSVSKVKEKLQEAQKRIDAGSFFIALVFGLIGYQFMLGIFIEWSDILRDRGYLELITPAFTILLGILSFIYVRKSRYPLKNFGLYPGNWSLHIREALLWTFFMLVAFTGLKWIFVETIPFYYGKPIFELNPMPQFNWSALVIIYMLYVVLVPVQEFVARGVIQGSLQRILTGRGKTAQAIILSNLMFSSFHLYIDVRFAILTFFPGVVWGILYARQGSLVGVIVSHIIVGLFALLCLGVN